MRSAFRNLEFLVNRLRKTSIKAGTPRAINKRLQSMLLKGLKGVVVALTSRVSKDDSRKVNK